MKSFETSVIACGLEADALRLIEDDPIFRNMQDSYYLITLMDPIDPGGSPYQGVGRVRITLGAQTGKVTDWQDQNFRYKNDIREVIHNGDLQPFLQGAHYSKDLR